MANSPGTRGTSGPEEPVWTRHRRYTRTDIKSEFVVVDLGQQGSAFIADISEGGMAVHESALLQAGEVRDFRFSLPGKDAPFEGTAMVAWIGSDAQAGMQFVNVSEGCRALLKDWLATPLSPGVQAQPTAQGISSPEREPLPRIGEQLEKSRGNDQQFDSAALAQVAERASSITGAHGAALAVGNALEMWCCASFRNAPDIGARVGPNSGLSGVCLRTTELVRCDDTETDPRVDPVASRQLNLRSVLIAPLLRDGSLIGLIEVFSSRPYAFDTRHEESLLRIAHFVSTLLSDVGVQQFANGSFSMPSARLAMAETAVQEAAGCPAPGPASSACNEFICTDAAPADAGTSRDVTASVAAATGSGPEAARTSAEWPVCDACGHPNPAGSIDCQRCDVPMPAVLSLHRAKNISELTQAAELTTAASEGPATTGAVKLQSQALTQSTKARLSLSEATKAAVTLVLLACAFVGGWYVVRARYGASPASINKSTPAMPDTAADIQPNARKDINLPLSQAAAVLPITKDPTSEITIEQSSLAVAAQEETPRSTSELSPGKLLKNVEPAYPPSARASGIGGAVVLTARVTRRGMVENVKLVRGPEVLAAPAMDAVRQWVYEPYRLDGEPVAVETTILVRFSPHK
jgi:TonB family protein